MLKIINKRGKSAVAIDEIKKIAGYLMGVRFTPARGKQGSRGYRAPSPIYIIQDKKTGERQELWGCSEIDGNLLDGGKLDATLAGAFVQLTFKGREKIKGRQQPMKRVEVMADISDKLTETKRGRDYILRK